MASSIKPQGLLVMAHELPDRRGFQITALNFGAKPVDELVELSAVPAGAISNMLTGTGEGQVDQAGKLRIHLGGYEGKSV